MDLLKIFKALADDTRLRIIRLLIKNSFTVNEIIFVIGGRQSNISHHLKILLDAALVTNKKEGSQIYYKLNDQTFDQLYPELKRLISVNKETFSFYPEDKQRRNIILEKRKKIAEEYFENLHEEDSRSLNELLNQIYHVEDYLSFFQPRCKSLLDIGCGNGRYLPKLAHYSEQVIGMDSSPRLLQLADHLAQENQLKYQLKTADITKIPLADQSIDGAFINMVLHHISEPEGALQEVSRIMTNKGKLLLIEFLEHNDDSMREKYADLWLGFSKTELTKWLENNQFTVNQEVVKELNEYKVIIFMAEKN
ncbi:MAG: metalloregulator ArsR/SmtB family transcription factor [Spirochaetes bacterium]|nr:metalloregulator ArsR/SmtB family transcription factor [Spirochaetota bacterium]